jgi:glycosyl transferase, family 25
MRVFVINLKRSADRRQRMEAALCGLGVPFEFFDAAEGRALRLEELGAEYDEAAVMRNIDRTLSINEIGCTISHRRIYRKMVEEGIERACVLEDDILIDGAFPGVLAYLDRAEMTNAVVKLDNYQEKITPCSVWGRRRLPGGYAYKKPVTTQWMAWGYALDLAAARAILATWPRIAFMSDDWKRMSAAVNIRCVQPAVVHQNTAFESILDEDRKDLLAKTYRPKRGLPKLDRLAHIAKTILKMLFT